jgi:hypothetical protein
MSDMVRIVWLAYPQTPPSPEMLGGFLQAFERNSVFAPSEWGPGERVRQPYSTADVLAAAGASPPPAIYLQRQKVVKYSGYFESERLPFLSFDFHKSFPARRWPELLELTDYAFAAVKPRFGILHIFRPTPEPWRTEQDRLLRWMTLAAYPVPVRFRANGPLGVGMRTWFGQDILRMFDRDRLLGCPALTRELDWGGVRLDLAEDLWNLEQADLTARWKKVMDFLAPSNALAEPVFESDGRTVNFRPSQAWRERSKKA